MTSYQPYLDFSAQGPTVQALMVLYGQFEKRQFSKPELLPFVVFMAFSVEAYLNSVGARNIKFWDDLERLPWRQKVSILHKNVGVNLDWGKEPLQFAADVFRMRDRLAHGKPETVLGPICADTQNANRHFLNGDLEPEWYKALTVDWIADAKDRYHHLMTYLGQLYGFHESDHLHSASGGFIEHENA